MDRLEVVWGEALRSYRFGPDHPFQEAPRALAVDLLQSSLGPSETEGHHIAPDPGPATLEQLQRFHRSVYLERVRSAGRTERRVWLDAGDTPAFPGCFEAAARVVGAALHALSAITDGRARRAFHPSGGLHHAHPDRASGFCIFNDLAVLIATAISPGGPFHRVAYIDIDAHHGDGVMYGFYGSGRLLDIDFHQDGRTLFPGTGGIEETGRGDGAGLKVNVPLPPGSGDELFVPLFERIVPPLLAEFRPDLIVLQHGVDAHVGDRLAGLRYGPTSYSRVLRRLIECSEELCGGRLIVTGGGGYSPSNVALALAVAGRLLAGAPEPVGPLPPDWRQRFASEIGEEAPDRWRTAATPGASDPGGVERIVEELSKALGRPLPASGP